MTYLVISTEASISDARHEHKRRTPIESIRHFVEMYNPLPRKFCRFVTKGLPCVPAKQAERAHYGAKQTTMFVAALWFRNRRSGKLLWRSSTIGGMRLRSNLGKSL